MRMLPKKRNERIKITQLKSGNFLIKHDRTHCLHYFWGAILINGEPLEYKNITHNQVFKWRDEKYLIELITKDEASDLVY